MGTAIEEMSRISDMGTRLHKTASSMTLRVVSHEGVHAEFTREAVEAVREGEAFSPGALKVTSTQLETDALAELSEKLGTPTVWTPTLAHAQRYLTAREMLAAYGLRVLAPVSRAYETSRLVGRLPGVEAIDEVSFPQAISRAVFEAYSTRILLPVSKVHAAHRSVIGFPLTEVVEAVPPTVQKLVKRGYEVGLASPRGLNLAEAVWPITEIGQAMAHGTTSLATRFPIAKVIAEGLKTHEYSMAIQVAGKPSIDPLRLETSRIKPLEQTFIETSSAFGVLPLTEVVEAAASPPLLAREMLTAYGVRVLAPVSQIYETSRLVGRLPIIEAIKEASFSQPDLPLPSQLTVEIAKAIDRVFPIPELVRSLRPIRGGEAKTYEKDFSRPEPPPLKVLVAEQTAIYPLDKQEAWMQSIREATKVASSYLGRVSDMLLGEEMARRLSAIPPFITEATETAQTVPHTSYFMSRTSRLTTPLSPLIMKLGFGIAEAKQLYPAVEAMSDVRRALDVSRILPREAFTHQAGTEEAIESIISVLHAPAERYTLERIPLEAPRAFPTIKLQEIVPLLSSIRAPTQRERPSRAPRVKAIERPRSIEVKVEPPRDERDLRELRRKITRILREEARRHGVY
jgi:hypothetical protein